MKRDRNLIVVAAVAALIVVATACSSNTSSSSAATSGTTSTSSSATDTSSASADTPANVVSKSTFALSANNFFFSPSALAGSAGQKLTLTVTNAGTVTHTFTIDSEHVDVTLQPGDSQQVDVTFPQSGSVDFYCKFHVSGGMKGTLQVA